MINIFLNLNTLPIGSLGSLCDDGYQITLKRNTIEVNKQKNKINISKNITQQACVKYTCKKKQSQHT